MRPHQAVIFLAAVGCRAPDPSSQFDGEVPTLAIRASRIFDGEHLLPPSTVILRNDRILTITEEQELPEGVALIDGRGCTLLPGLIDAHTHLTCERELQQALAFGVTTELDMYTFLPPELGAELRRQLESGQRKDLADFRMATTPATCPGGLGVRFNPDISTLADATEARAFVDARLEEGADYIKIMYDDGRVFGGQLPNLTPDVLGAVVRAAHDRGKIALVHVTTRSGARDALKAGVDGLAHVFCDELPDEDLSRRMADRGMFVIATLTTLQGAFEDSGGAELAADERFLPYLHDSALENLRKPHYQLQIGSFANCMETVRRLHEAGVSILAGTDVSNAGTAHGISIHRELELLVGAGLTPGEALAAATSGPADCFGLADRGRIAPGLRADLLLVRGDPSTDVLATRDIVAVFRGGELVDRAVLSAAIASSAE